MSIEQELKAYNTFLKNAYDKCIEKNADIPTRKNLENLTDCIDSIVGDPAKSGDSVDIPAGALYLFPFDENTTNIIDKSQSMTTKGSITSATAKWGSSLYTSSESYIVLSSSIPTSIQLKTTGTATIEFWGKGNMNVTYGNREGDSGAVLTIRDTYISVQYVAGGESASYSLTDGTITQEWYHIAWVFNGGTVSVFLNGNKVISKSFLDSAGGNSYRYLVFKNGYIDDLVVSTEALYTSDFEIPEGAYGGMKTLQKLYVYKNPTKTIYQSGEYFDISGAKIMAEYSNNAVTDVTTDCIVVETEPITATTKYRTVTYTYKDVTKTVYINVSAYTIESTLDLSATKLLLPFDGYVDDIVGNNKITVVGNNTFSSLEEGKFGQAKYFNGSTDYISMPYTDDINIDTGDFTVACWIKLLTVEGLHVIWSNMNSTYGSRVYTSGNKLYTAICTNTNDSTISGLSGIEVLGVNTWYHIALVRKGNTFTSYLDGKIVATAEYSSTLASENNLLIGRFTDSQPFLFNGYIDDLIITKSALWTSEFTPPNASLKDEAIKQLDIQKGVESLYLMKSPTKTVYEVGESFSLDGAEIRATFVTGEDENVTEECVIVSDPIMTKETTKMTISYTLGNFTKTLDIYVSVYGSESYYEKYGIVCAIDCNNNVNDLVGNNAVRVLGVEQYSEEGKFSQAFQGGNSNCIDIPYSSSVNLSNSIYFTIAGWYYWKDGTWVTLFSNRYRYNASNKEAGTTVFIRDSTSIYWKIYTTYSTKVVDAAITGLTIPKNEWVHFALVRTGEYLSLFMNGKKIGSVTLSSSTTSLYHHTSSSWKFGGANISSSATNTQVNNPFYGLIDDCIISKKALWTGNFTPPTSPYAR